MEQRLLREPARRSCATQNVFGRNGMEAPVLWRRVAKNVLWRSGRPGVGDWLLEETKTMSAYSEVCCGQTINVYSATTKREAGVYVF